MICQHKAPRSADIGETEREVTFEPLPDTKPLTVPTPAPAETPDRELVPA